MTDLAPSAAAPRHYYDKEIDGDLGWMMWIIVFGMTMVTWMLGQTVLTGPFPSMLQELDPEAFAQFNEAMAGSMSPESMGIGKAFMLLGGFLLLFIGGAMVVIAGLIHMLGTRSKGSRITAMIGGALTIVATVLLVQGSGDMAEMNSILMSVMGLSVVAYILMLLTFPAALVGLYFGWKFGHLKSLTSLHTSWSKFRWGRAGQAFFIMWAVLAAAQFLSKMMGLSDPMPTFDAARFFPYALASLLLLPIQSATEEIVVRGYMNKGLIQFIGNKWVAFVLTSGLFMALHLANPEAAEGAKNGNLPIVMSGYFFFGFAACLMVLIDDGLESAIGVHAANNTFAGIFVNYENSVLPTPSLYIVESNANADAIGTIVILSIVLGLLYVTRKTRTGQDAFVA